MRPWVFLSLISLAGPLSAAPFPSCVKKSSSTYAEPPTLAALIKCHREKLDASKRDFVKANGFPPADLAMERWEDQQRAEVRDYLRRHEDQASLDEPSGTTLVDEEGGRDKGFERSLMEKSDGGKQGITPEMAEDILKYLQKKQGGASRDMKGLLEAVKGDGAELSDDTVRRLKEAARKAKDEGLDLRVKPDVERFLLEPDQRPDSGPGPSRGFE